MMPMSTLRDAWEAQLQDGEPFLTALMRSRNIPIITAPPKTVWIWSDLHLSDRTALEAWERPFRNTDEMDRHLLGAWNRKIRSENTIVCLGDVAHPDAWRKRRTLLDLRNCPGHRLLVLGNHDVLNTEHLRDAGFTDQHPAALCATDPPLALTHMPLREPPPGTVNVHGHLHDADAPSERHFNVSVERTDYAPVRLDRLLEIWVRRQDAAREALGQRQQRDFGTHRAVQHGDSNTRR